MGPTQRAWVNVYVLMHFFNAFVLLKTLDSKRSRAWVRGGRSFDSSSSYQLPYYIDTRAMPYAKTNHMSCV